ncbi:PAS domain-containing protein [Mucilaginibacter sp. HD30]
MLTDQDLLHVLSLSKDATAVYCSADLHIGFVNNAMLKIWGKDKSVLGRTFEEAIPEIKGQPFTGMLRKVWNSGETITATATPATLIIDGEAKTSYFDFEYRALLNNAGKTYAILHTATDVTGRVQALDQITEKQQREEQLIAELSNSGYKMSAVNKELLAANTELQTSNQNISRLNTRLQESETDFKRLVERAPVAILVFRGQDMVIDQVNQAMLAILNKDSSIIGKPLLKGLPEIQDAPAVDMLFEVYNTGKALDGNEAPVPMMRNGKLETRYFNFSYRPLLDNDVIIGVMDIAVEVTEQVLARKPRACNCMLTPTAWCQTFF